MDTQKILTHIQVVKGDITKETTDAIVNAANTSLLGGGGVDGAIHRAAGPELVRECASFGGCPTGEARITSGYRLKAKYVIHTPGPVYRGGTHGEAELLRSCYVNCMALAAEHNLSSISFPGISTGVYHFPKEEACRIAVTTVIDFMKENNLLIDVRFVMFDDDNYEIYTKMLKSLGQS